MRPAQLVIELTQDERRVFDILKFAVTVQVGAVKFYVGMDMGFVHMSSHHKLMLSPGKFHCKLIAETVGLFGADLPRLKGLHNQVHNNIMIW